MLESLREARVEMIVNESIVRGEPRQQEVTLETTALGLPPRHLDISAVPLRTKKDEDVGGAVVVFHDITRIKQLEVLRQEFVSNVSHELRTPLAIFRGYLETLQDNPDLPRDELQRILETLQRHSDRLFALVEDLLTLSRFEARTIKTEFSTIRMDAFFRQIVRDWSHRKSGAEVELKVEIDDNLPAVDADAIRLEQVMLNLLDNAVAYSNPPRKVGLIGGGARRDDGGARDRQRHRHPARRPAAHLRAFLPRRQGAQPQLRRHRPRPLHREADHPDPRRHRPRRERARQGDQHRDPAAAQAGEMIGWAWAGEPSLRVFCANIVNLRPEIAFRRFPFDARRTLP